MAKTIGVVMTEAIRSGFLDDHKIIGATRRFPENMDESTGLIEVPTDALAESICDEAGAAPVESFAQPRSFAIVSSNIACMKSVAMFSQSENPFSCA